MAAAYAWADLVICRAGALTIAEIAAAGAASILIPFPYAVDNHQYTNALYLAQSGAAEVIAQSEFTPERATQVLENYIAHPNVAGKWRTKLVHLLAHRQPKTSFHR